MKTAKKSDKLKLEELKKKIHNKDYLDRAVLKIAQSLTDDFMHEEWNGISEPKRQQK